MHSLETKKIMVLKVEDGIEELANLDTASLEEWGDLDEEDEEREVRIFLTKKKRGMKIGNF